MKKIVLASACILALASPAGAQTTKPSDGASSQGNVGPGASQGAIKEGTGTMNRGTTAASSRPSRLKRARCHCQPVAVCLTSVKGLSASDELKPGAGLALNSQ